MKVIHALYSDRKGGLEQAFVNVTQMLLLLGHDVELWVPVKAPYLDGLEASCKRVDLTSHGYFDLFAMMRQHLQLRKSHPDLIITHNSRATSLLSRVNKGLAIPHLAFSHGYKTHRFKNVDHLVALTEHMKQHFISAGHPPVEISVFPNVIHQVPELPMKTEVIDNRPIRLGFVGRLAEEKGLEDLLESLSMLKNKFPLELHIAGSGPDQAKINDLSEKLGISSLLFFSGWVDDIQSWMSSIDLILVPSRAESFGMVVLEAAAYGCPVIACDVDGPASQITDGENGWLVKPNDPTDLAIKMIKVLESQNSWHSVREKAHSRAQNYLMKTKMHSLKEILNKLTSEKT